MSPIVVVHERPVTGKRSVTILKMYLKEHIGRVVVILLL